MTKNMTITIASVPDNEDLVAELWHGDLQWAQLSLKGGQYILEVYANPNEQFWLFSFDEVQSLLVQAKQKLIDNSDDDNMISVM